MTDASVQGHAKMVIHLGRHETPFEDGGRVVRTEDPASSLSAIVKIHDTTLGPALGGLRLIPCAFEDEGLFDVLRLAKGITYMSAVTKSGLGGGTAVILEDSSIKDERFRLHENWVDRFEAIDRIVDSASESVVAVMFWHGMGGTGKTHLAVPLFKDVAKHIAERELVVSAGHSKGGIVQLALRKLNRGILAGQSQGAHISERQQGRHRKLFPVCSASPGRDLDDVHGNVWEWCSEGHGFTGREVRQRECAGRMPRNFGGLSKVAITGHPGTGKSCLVLLIMDGLDDGIRLDQSNYLGESVSYISDEILDSILGRKNLLSHALGASLGAGAEVDGAIEDTMPDKHGHFTDYLDHPRPFLKALRDPHAHCDLKPANRLWIGSLDRVTRAVRSIDFGISKRAAHEDYGPVTLEDMVVDSNDSIGLWASGAVPYRIVVGERRSQDPWDELQPDRFERRVYGTGSEFQRLREGSEDRRSRITPRIFAPGEDQGDIHSFPSELVQRDKSEQPALTRMAAILRDIRGPGARDELVGGTSTTLAAADADKQTALASTPTRVRVFISYAHEDASWFEGPRKALLRKVYSWWHDAKEHTQDALTAFSSQCVTKRLQQINTLDFSMGADVGPWVRREITRLVPECELERIGALSTHRATSIALMLAAELGAIGEVTTARVQELERYLDGICTRSDQGSDGNWACLLRSSATTRWHRKLIPIAFLVNRAMSFPEESVRAHNTGIARLGGTLEAIATAWSFTQRWWILASSGDALQLSLCETKESTLYSLVKAMASALGCEVVLEPDRSIGACLIKTKVIRRIYLDCSLDLPSRAFYMCHELAHEMLRHREADHILVRANAQQLAEHRAQEEEADALAAIMLHVMSGLIELWQPGIAERHLPERSSSSETQNSEQWANTA